MKEIKAWAVVETIHGDESTAKIIAVYLDVKIAAHIATILTKGLIVCYANPCKVVIE